MTASSTAKVLPGAGLAVDDAHGTRRHHVGHRPLAERVVLAADHARLQVEEVAAHPTPTDARATVSGTANPGPSVGLQSEQRHRPGPGPPSPPGRSSAVKTVVGSAPSVAVPGDSR